MFENLMKFFKKFNKKDDKVATNSKDAAKERLHLVLMQDRANVSADFLELMKQEIIEVIKKYIDVDEGAIDVRLTNKENADGTNGAPALYANIPILNIKNEARKVDSKEIEKNNEDKKAETNKKEKESNKEEAKKEIIEQKDDKLEKNKEEKNKEENKEEDKVIIENNEEEDKHKIEDKKTKDKIKSEK